MTPKILGLVVPCYNEEDVLQQTAKRLTDLLTRLIKKGSIAKKSYVLFVDDGSRDSTWAMIKGLAQKHAGAVKGVRLNRNYGHQYALLAGLMSAKEHADVVISIDADLQQDEQAVPDFLAQYYKGNDIVFGVREDRNTDGVFKKATALFFYNLMQIMGVRIIKNHADYRLTSKRALEALSGFQESNLFLRGIFPALGFRTAIVNHVVRDRFAGTSKYSLGKMFAFALNGITSFSITPIRLITALGAIVFVFSISMSIYAFIVAVMGKAVIGWASTVIPIYFLGGVQLLSMGLLGEYIGKIYNEVKQRPRYIIDEELL